MIDILGLKSSNETEGVVKQELVEGLMSLVIDMRQQFRQQKDWGSSDAIRNKLEALQIRIKDGKEGVNWEFL